MLNRDLLKQLLVVCMSGNLLIAIASAGAEVKYSDFNRELVEANSAVKTRKAGDSANRVAEFDSEKLLRCWQEGQLISTDREWKPVSGQAPDAVFRKGSQEMFLYEFGQTFCIYTGE